MADFIALTCAAFVAFVRRHSSRLGRLFLKRPTASFAFVPVERFAPSAGASNRLGRRRRASLRRLSSEERFAD
jgi:hypothetical protein